MSKRLSKRASLSVRLRSRLLSLWKRSWGAHASLPASDLEASLAFYAQLGFSQVSASRGGEVTLLRNHQGAELNLVKVAPDKLARDEGSAGNPQSVAIETHQLLGYVTELRNAFPTLELERDAVSNRVTLLDPHHNRIEFFELLDRSERARKRIYHVATESEIGAGLSEHYYMPPSQAQRFLYCAERSALVDLACNRVAAESNAAPMVVEMEQEQLTIEAEWHGDSDQAADDSRLSTYPRVLSPIPRSAIVAIGRCELNAERYSWPERFRSQLND